MKDKKYIEQLKECLYETLDYNPETGIFRWKTENHQHRMGEASGSLHHTGYQRIYLFGRNFQDAILANLYVTGEYESYIGRVDKDYTNCKFDNLYVSERKIIPANKRARASKVEIMQVLDGKPSTIGKIATKLSRTPQDIREQLEELYFDKYVSRGYGKIYTITALGHKDIVSKGAFKQITSIIQQLYDFQKALPGTLTGATHEHGVKQAQLKKRYA